MFRGPRRSVPPIERWRRMFPDIIRRGKAIDFLATVGIPAVGIAYNHYGIKYVLKRLGDQRRSKGRTHMEGGERWGGGERERER